jgi:hypothetical protein
MLKIFQHLDAEIIETWRTFGNDLPVIGAIGVLRQRNPTDKIAGLKVTFLTIVYNILLKPAGFIGNFDIQHALMNAVGLNRHQLLGGSRCIVADDPEARLADPYCGVAKPALILKEILGGFKSYTRHWMFRRFTLKFSSQPSEHMHPLAARVVFAYNANCAVCPARRFGSLFIKGAPAPCNPASARFVMFGRVAKAFGLAVSFERSSNRGTSGHPLWKAVPDRNKGTVQ